jgi:phosphoribosylanthranilate isomerase
VRRIAIKICGLTSAADAQASAELGADYGGLIFAASPRCVTSAAAAQMAPVLSGTGCAPVAVFRDQSLELIHQSIADTNIKLVQLHGDEPVELAKSLCEQKADLAIVRACTLRSPESVEATGRWCAQALAAGVRIEAILLDAPKDAPRTPIAQYANAAAVLRQAGVPIWCAGGLTPDNVSEAVLSGAFDGVDVASGVESSPGVKDFAKLAAFIAAARYA